MAAKRLGARILAVIELYPSFAITTLYMTRRHAHGKCFDAACRGGCEPIERPPYCSTSVDEFRVAQFQCTTVKSPTKSAYKTG